MSKPKAPPPPDYAGMAAAQGAANKDTSIFDAAMNRPTEIDTNGMRQWSLRPGADPKNPQPGDYIVNTQLNDVQQGLYDQQNRISGALGTTAETSLGRVDDMMSSGLDLSGAPQLATADSGYQDSIYNAMMSRARPDMERQRGALDNRLMNSGFEMGSEGYQEGMEMQGRQENDLMMQALLGSGGEARAAAGAQNQARGQSISELLMQRQLPLNEANALRTGSQVGAFNPAQFATGQTQAAPIMDAGIAQGNYDMAAYQQKLAGSNALLGGLANMGAAYLGKPSDRRLKTNIRPAGTRAGWNWYTWDWIDGTGSSEGVMADEVEARMPDAVVNFGAFKAVRYHMLGVL